MRRIKTRYGRPQWNALFDEYAAMHPESDVGVFYCGPKPLGQALSEICTAKSVDSGEDGTRFFFQKEEF